MGKSMLGIRGFWKIVLKDKDGRVKETRRGENIVVTAGKNHLADHLSTQSSAYPMKYLAIGTGTTAEDAAQTALVTENCTRVTGTQTDTTNVYQVVGTFAAGNGTGAVTEYGIFNSATPSGSVMLCRDLESVINKGASDSLEVTCQITLG